MSRDQTANSGKPPNPLQKVFRDPAARVYFLIAAAALGVLVATMFLIGSPLAAAVILTTGLLGLALRWTAMPVCTILAVAYFSFAPLGVPFDIGRFSQIPGSWFRIPDLLVIGNACIFLFAQYRLYAIVHQGMPFEAPKGFVKAGTLPTTRVASEVTDSELIRFFLRIGFALLAGQLLWIAVNNLSVDFSRVPPLRVGAVDEDPLRVFRSDYQPPPVSSGLSRFLLAAAFFVLLGFGLRLAFWYWHLRTLGPDEAKLILIDTQWSEQRRELNRREKWRAWAKNLALGVKAKKERAGCLFWIVIGIFVMMSLLSMTCCFSVFR